MADVNNIRISPEQMETQTNEFDEKYERPSDAFIKNFYQNVDPGEVEITIRTILRMDENLKEEASCG